MSPSTLSQKRVELHRNIAQMTRKVGARAEPLLSRISKKKKKKGAVLDLKRASIQNKSLKYRFRIEKSE
jgi:hypothetical protein